MPSGADTSTPPVLLPLRNDAGGVGMMSLSAAFTTAWVRNPSDGALNCDSSATRISGTATDGTYEKTCTIPPNAPGGTYIVQVVADDPIGNHYFSNATTFTVQGP